MDTCVLVAAHKLFDDRCVPKNEGYQIIGVGKDMEKVDLKNIGYFSSSEGNNIKEKHPYYCELVAQYWGWKNLPNTIKYIGISHYRRFFFNYKISSNSIKDNIITENEIKSILQKYKVIMAYPTIKIPGKGTLYKNVPEEDQDIYWINMKKIIEKEYSEYMPSFNKIMYGCKTTWGNMFISTREVFDNYSEWLFSVLEKYDSLIENENVERIPRLDGYLAEYLLLIWMHHNYKKNQIYYLEVRNTETDSFIELKKNLLGKTVKKLRCNRFILARCREIRLLWLYIKRFDTKRICNVVR